MKTYSHKIINSLVNNPAGSASYALVIVLLLLSVWTPPAWSVTGDISGDGIVDLKDLDALLYWWLSSPCAVFDNCDGADMTGPPEYSGEGEEGGPDGVVDFYDFALLAAHWLEQDV